MPTMNRVYLMGNLTRDPEMRYLPSGTAVADMRMAINRQFRTADGKAQKETCYVSVAVWGRQAELCREYLSKGSGLMVEGRLKYDEWVKDGRQNSTLRVVADRVQFVGRPRRAEAGPAPEAEERPAAEADERPAAEAAAASGDEAGAARPAAGDADDLPF
jgi:single-strand DNA-binding protein